jgi:hypothetical protein
LGLLYQYYIQCNTFYFDRFIYTEHVDLKSFEQAYEISYAAKKYMVSSLVEKCSQYMWKDLIPDNVCRALEFANLFEDSLLKVNILIKSASGTVKL